MKQIELSQGKVALVDDHWYEYLSQWKWSAMKINKRFYAVRTEREGKNTKTILMHRVINKTPGDMATDHINGNGLDNRECNLRTCTITQNNHNIGTYSNKKYKGVSSSKKKWRARIHLKGKTIAIGSYPTPEEAAQAYDQKAHELFGDFAWLNFPTHRTTR